MDQNIVAGLVGGCGILFELACINYIAYQSAKDDLREANSPAEDYRIKLASDPVPFYLRPFVDLGTGRALKEYEGK